MTRLMEQNPRIKNVAEYLDQIQGQIEMDKRFESKRFYDMDTAKYSGVVETLRFLGYSVEYKGGNHIIY